MMRKFKRLFGAAQMLGLLAIALVVWMSAGESQARLRPYYVLEGTSFGNVAPRILFVLDTSATMAYKAQAEPADCDFDKCEGEDSAEMSRIAAARKAIHEVILATHDVATYAFMTFDQMKSPQGSVPAKCKIQGKNYRFKWTDTYSQVQAQPLNRYPGYTGAWRLCDSRNVPYPYLRWDELGVGAKIGANNQDGPVPASPLISTAEADMKDDANRDRRVQWFPRFLGLRINLNAETDPGQEMLGRTIGDWATKSSDKLTEVWGHDFYYWPYVAGFPGYSAHNGDDGERLGVFQEDTSVRSATLYAPFYINVPAESLNPNYWGPQSVEEAEALVFAHTNKLTEGGVDVAHYSPWSAAIGTIPNAPLKSNAIFSHGTVGSYLKFVTNIEGIDMCRETVAILVTDGYPEPEATQGGWKLYKRLADLRLELNVKIYVVGFFVSGGPLNEMACAGAGACDGNQCSTPCDDTPVKSWDTCSNPLDPGTECAYLAESAEELAKVLAAIVDGILDQDVAAGPSMSINSFGVGAGGEPGAGSIVQTTVNGHTEWPGWQGHVIRDVCDDRVDPDDPNSELEDYCKDGDVFDEFEETFGPCTQSRSWDAAECLQQTTWSDRKIYSYKADHKVYRITDNNGAATTDFEQELVALKIIEGADTKAQADSIAAFILGRGWPDNWKLPGLANAAPIVVRRVPKYTEKYLPSVPIRDPHCAGRRLSAVDEDIIPDSLTEFSVRAWDPDKKLDTPSEHYEYQEAVLIGDDLGVLHAFQFDSGNELWGFLPRFLLETAAQQAAVGPESMGQPDELDDHIYGISGTINQGWTYDYDDDQWRHLGVISFGIGSTELVAVDLSHMSPSAPEGPIEVLWTTEDAGLKSTYDKYAGETWARPALTYEVPENDPHNLPIGRLIFGTGHPSTPATHSLQGRVLMMADALTGKLIETAQIPAPSEPVYEPLFGTVVDSAVASHCISRFWAEMQEVYIADPAGRLYRWDQTRDPGEEPHESDSVGLWDGVAQQIVRFPACQGEENTCTVASGNKGDVFVYGPSVTANDRIDPFDGLNYGSVAVKDQMLVALASGSPMETEIDSQVEGSDFHSSLYLLVDDHGDEGEKHGGFDIPPGAPKMVQGAIGSHANYMRIALSDVTRTRVYTPYEGSPSYEDTRTFWRGTRPIRAPRIHVKGVLSGDDNEVQDKVEVFYITYMVYEPRRDDEVCDEKWYDPIKKEWHYDEGSSYQLTFRVTADSVNGFDFLKGAPGTNDGGIVDFDPDFKTGLVLESVEQVSDGGCADGVCGPNPGMTPPKPCDNNDFKSGVGGTAVIPILTTELSGFTPVE